MYTTGLYVMVLWGSCVRLHRPTVVERWRLLPGPVTPDGHGRKNVGLVGGLSPPNLPSRSHHPLVHFLFLQAWLLRRTWTRSSTSVPRSSTTVAWP